ncbi:ADP-ribosylglycohydrolase family protein [Haloarcula sebkhae]|uniref:ADP-ribosylglycohydrolase family protein n=2 Tax=Haloarcula sebkhae TaxID=932660 RepID=A0ACC6VLX3_9EURY|nr:ADP-ribosylglycohydrolase family protein [Haloarcula sebkhae]GGK84642.1 ADP-ribosyl-[dinitrogen reductase] glycohydrolase [Haloarcula sebkhae]
MTTSVEETDVMDRSLGVFLGLACGDALGRPVEFRTSSGIEDEYGTLTEMRGYGTHNQPAGTITDDTDLALRIARSLAENGGFNGADIADRFVDWYDDGPFDIGGTTSGAIRRLKSGEPWDSAGHSEWEQSSEGSNAGNGSLMRTAPYSIAYADDIDPIITHSLKSSAITHADPRCQVSCAIYNMVLVDFIQGRPPLDMAIGAYNLAVRNGDVPESEEVMDAVTSVKTGDIQGSPLENSGYVVSTLQTSLYHGLTADTAEDAIVNAVNMGGDADTIGAVTGALAGARFGASSLPDRWLSEIDETDEIRELVHTLHEL